MSRRGAETSPESHIELVEVGALGRGVVKAASALLDGGLTPAEACSLLAHAAAALARQKNGLSRDEFLGLCEELFDGDEVESDARLSAPGGSA